MGKRASTTSQSYSSGAMNTIILDYITWSEVVSKFYIIYVLNVSETKKKAILDFFNTYIIPNNKSINDGYIYEKTGIRFYILIIKDLNSKVKNV